MPSIMQKISLPVLIAAFLLLAITVAQQAPQAWEQHIMLQVHQHVGAWYQPIAVAMHYLGKTSWAVAGIALVVLVLIYRQRWRTALFLTLAPLASTLTMLAVKDWVARPRPMLWPRVIEETNWSFPSGHSSFGMVLALIAVRLWPKHTAVFAAAALFALLMGFSRIWLGVHYPSDVLAGWINGLFWTSLLYALIFRQPKP